MIYSLYNFNFISVQVNKPPGQFIIISIEYKKTLKTDYYYYLFSTTYNAHNTPNYRNVQKMIPTRYGTKLFLRQNTLFCVT